MLRSNLEYKTQPQASHNHPESEWIQIFLQTNYCQSSSFKRNHDEKCKKKLEGRYSTINKYIINSQAHRLHFKCLNDMVPEEADQ